MNASGDAATEADRADRGASDDAALRRSRICISCRTLFETGQDCPGKRHHTVSLITAAGRDQIDDEVWGPDSRARAMRQAAKAGAGGATLGGIFEGCDANGLSGCDIPADGEAIIGALAVILAVAVVAVLSVALWWLVKLIIRLVRNAMDRPKPSGALLEPPKPAKMAVAGKGTVRTGTPLKTPWKAGHALAYAMELYEKRVFGGGAMLRDASTAGFEVTLDDGRVLKVPAGRVRILGKRERVEPDDEKIKAFVGAIDADRDQAPRPLFPYDFARAVTIDPGDRVEVLGDVEIAADATGSTGYRANAGFVTPVGVPVLRVHKAGAAAAPNVRVAVTPSAGRNAKSQSAADEEEDAAAQHEAHEQDQQAEEARQQQQRREMRR